MIVRKEFIPNQPLTEEQKKMLEEASKRPIHYDEDSPKLSPEMLAQFYRVSDRPDRQKKFDQD